MVGRISAILALVALGALARGAAFGQIMIVNGPNGEETPKSTGFSVRKEPQPIVDALAEFDRYSGKEAWEKAFASLATAADATPTGLIPAKDGFYLPTRLRVRQALCGLSPAGRAAYRLFNDAKAKQAFDEIGPAVSPAQISKLRDLADHYFITSIGDQANDRLGDSLFESGDFAGAAARWRSILSDYPDSAISTLRLLTKQGIALTRAGDHAAFAEVLANIRNRYAGQTVHLGGKDLVAVDYLESIAPTPTTNVSETTNTPLQLPSDPTPVWQFPLMDDATRDQINQALSNMGWGMMVSNLLGGIAPVAVDEKRIYVNWMSVCFALDLRTGKMLWRSDKIVDQAQRIQQMIQQGQDLAGDAVAAAADPQIGDRVLIVRRDPQNQNYNAPRQLLCLSAATGKTQWKSDDLLLLKNWNFSGTPLVIGQTAYIVAHGEQQQDASLLAISIKDGSQLWTLELGTSTQKTNFRGMQSVADAVLVASGSKLYALTNDGALLAVDLPSHALEWAFTYQPSAPAWDPRFGFNPMFQNTMVHTPGAIQIIGSTLLLKEADNPAMYAIDLTAPSLLWRRPVDASQMIAHADRQGVLLLGEDLSYMDFSSRDLVWSARLPGLGTAIGPVLSPGHIDLFLPRGIFDMDTTDGDTLAIFRGYDHDTAGGTLWRSGDRLITVSDRSITAYPIR